MAACVSTPTATQFATITSSGVSTSFSTSVTTLQASSSTELITSCLSSAVPSLASGTATGGGGGAAACVASTIITSISVISGGTSAVQVPVEVTTRFTTTSPTRTLYAPCSGTTTPTTSTPTPTTPTTSSSTPPSTSTTPAFTQTSTVERTTTTFQITTPSTTFTSSFDSTMTDGQVTQVISTVTSALPPTSVAVTTTVPQGSTQINSGSSSSSPNLGPIIGGSVGGFLALVAIAGVILYFCRRRRTNWDDLFEEDYDKAMSSSRNAKMYLESEPASTEPKPYEYGLVGASSIAPTSLNAGVVRDSATHASIVSTDPLLNSHASSSASRPGTGTSGMSALSSGSGQAPVSSAAGPAHAFYNGPTSAGLSHAPVSSAGSANAFYGSATVAAGMNSTGGPVGGPGPLSGVLVDAGPPLAGAGILEPESPRSIMGPMRGPLFIANRTADADDQDRVSPPGSPAGVAKLRKGKGKHRAAIGSVASMASIGSSLASAGGVLPGSSTNTSMGYNNNRASLAASIDSKREFFAQVASLAPAESKQALLEKGDTKEQGPKRSETVSSGSVYSQASPSEETVTPRQHYPMHQSLSAAATGVVVHTDGGVINARSASAQIDDQPPAYEA